MRVRVCVCVCVCFRVHQDRPGVRCVGRLWDPSAVCPAVLSVHSTGRYSNCPQSHLCGHEFYCDGDSVEMPLVDFAPASLWVILASVPPKCCFEHVCCTINKPV